MAHCELDLIEDVWVLTSAVDASNHTYLSASDFRLRCAARRCRRWLTRRPTRCRYAPNHVAVPYQRSCWRRESMLNQRCVTISEECVSSNQRRRGARAAADPRHWARAFSDDRSDEMQCSLRARNSSSNLTPTLVRMTVGRGLCEMR